MLANLTHVCTHVLIAADALNEKSIEKQTTQEKKKKIRTNKQNTLKSKKEKKRKARSIAPKENDPQK